MTKPARIEMIQYTNHDLHRPAAEKLAAELRASGEFCRVTVFARRPDTDGRPFARIHVCRHNHTEDTR